MWRGGGVGGGVGCFSCPKAHTPLQPSEKVEKERNVKVFGLTSGTC